MTDISLSLRNLKMSMNLLMDVADNYKEKTEMVAPM